MRSEAPDDGVNEKTILAAFAHNRSGCSHAPALSIVSCLGVLCVHVGWA